MLNRIVKTYQIERNEKKDHSLSIFPFLSPELPLIVLELPIHQNYEKKKTLSDSDVRITNKHEERKYSPCIF